MTYIFEYSILFAKTLLGVRITRKVLKHELLGPPTTGLGWSLEILISYQFLGNAGADAARLAITL